MDIKRLYGYSVQELVIGIVLADSVEEAREKVKAAYKGLSDTECIEIWKLDENLWSPDVIEIMDI